MRRTTQKTPPHVNEFLDKSYRLDRSDNYGEFLSQLGVTRSTRLQAMKSEPMVTLTKTDDEYVLSTSYPEGRIVKVRFKIGEEMRRRRPAGGETSSLFEIVNNRLIENQYVDGTSVLVEREFRPKELIVTMTLDKVACCRWYNLLGQESVPSYGTETSRRMPLWETESFRSYLGKVEESVTEELLTSEDMSETCL